MSNFPIFPPLFTFGSRNLKLPVSIGFNITLIKGNLNKIHFFKFIA